MKLDKIFFLFFLILFGCEEEEVLIYSTECVECIQYEYQQVYNDTSLVIILEPDKYCLGDSIFNYIYNEELQFLEILNEELIDLITQNGYCTFLLDTIIVE